MLNEIITFLVIFAVSALIMLYYGKRLDCFELSFKMNVFAPFLITSFVFLLACIYAFSGIFTKTICFILYALVIYHLIKYIELRKIYKHNLYYKKIAEEIRSTVYTECKNKHLPYGFEKKFNYILDRLLYKEYYSFDTDFTYDTSPKFCDVLGLFRDALRSYENYSDEITLLYDSASKSESTTEEETEYLEHLLSVTNKMVKEVHELLGTDEEGTDKYYKLTYENYRHYSFWTHYDETKNATPENQDEE